MKRLFMAVGLVAMIFTTGCQEEHKGHTELESTFVVTNPVRRDTSITQNYVCQIHSYQHIELRALEGGYIEKIFVDEGQLVEKGQMMFQVMPMLYQAEFEKAKAEANYAEIEYMNTKSLADSNIVSQNELALVKAELDKAKAELQLAQTHLQFTEIKAPFEGLMDHFHVRLGSLVEEGELLSTLSDNSEMWVYFNVPEAEYLDYRTKVKKDSSISVKLLMANNKLFEHEGLVTTIEADFNNATGNIAFRATFPNPDRLLRHGETGSVLMTIPLKNALLIPQKATFEILDKKYVFVVDEDNTVHSRQIIVGEEMTHLYVVKEGLSETDRILIDGLHKVRDNDKIETEYEAPLDVFSSLDLYAE